MLQFNYCPKLLLAPEVTVPTCKVPKKQTIQTLYYTHNINVLLCVILIAIMLQHPLVFVQTTENNTVQSLLVKKKTKQNCFNCIAT